MLKIENLCVDLVLDKNYRIIDNISLNIEKGKIVSIVGESGSGKTLTFLTVLKLLSENMVISSGRILVDNIDIVGLSENEMLNIRSRKIFMIFQEVMNAFNPVVNIERQMVEILTAKKDFDYDVAKEMACSSLEIVGIDRKRISDYPHNFSGGQRQRILIAMALLSDSPLIIADEITTALDVVTQIEILNLIKRLAMENQKTFVLITHNIGIAYKYSDYIYVMYLGQIVEHGLTKDVINKPAHPYTSALLNSIVKLGKNKSIKPINGLPPSIEEWNSGCRFFSRCPYASSKCFYEKPPERLRESGFYYCWEI